MISDNIIYDFYYYLFVVSLAGPDLGIKNGFLWEITCTRINMSESITVLTDSLFSRADNYTLSEAWSGVNWADLIAAQGAFRTDFYDRSIILHPKHRAYYRSDRPVIINIGPKGALGSQEIRPIHSAPSLGQSSNRKKKMLVCHYWVRGETSYVSLSDDKIRWACNYIAWTLVVYYIKTPTCIPTWWQCSFLDYDT